MSKRPATIEGRLTFRLIDSDAKDGKYQLVADGSVFALVRFVDGEWRYPGGDLLEFGPTHYRPASALMKPEGADA
ncbi:MAG: hypothetical protein ABL914_10955 [Novosphingobium sp.]|uniref:hypothetical protein n=1 Tax=Novosphingobium sp. TaxID=1874826 RepID=UPI0032BA5955